MAVPANNYSQFGLQQDDAGYFSPIPGFGISGTDTSPEALAAMSPDDLRTFMLSSMIKSQESGNQANLGLLATQLNEVGSLGAAGEQQITDVFEQERGRSAMSLQARGLSGTTVVGAESAGLAGRESRARTQFSESLTQQRLGILGGANFQQPNMGQFYGQMLQAGQAGVGQGAANQPPWYAGPALGAGIDIGTTLLKEALKPAEETTIGQVAGAVSDTAGVVNLANDLRGSPSDTGIANAANFASDTSGFADLSDTTGFAQINDTAGTASLSDAGNVTRGQTPDDGGFWNSAGEWVSDTASDIADSAGEAWDWTKENAGEAIGTAYTATKAAATAAASKAGPALAVAAPWIAVGVAAFLVWRNNKEKIGDLYDDAEEYVKDMYDDTEERTKEMASELAENVLAETKRTGKKIEEETKRVVEDVEGFGEDIGKGVKKTGKKVKSWYDKQRDKWGI